MFRLKYTEYYPIFGMPMESLSRMLKQVAYFSCPRQSGGVLVVFVLQYDVVFVLGLVVLVLVFTILPFDLQFNRMF